MKYKAILDGFKLQSGRKIMVGDCLDALTSLPDGCIQTVVTSPPYWGLRDYGVPPRLWDGDPACPHEWEAVAPRRDRSVDDVKDPNTMQNANKGANIDLKPTDLCRKCGCWRGALGLEPTPQLFVSHLVTIFNEVKRVLRDDGTVWLNIGDSYCAGSRNSQREQTIAGKPRGEATALRNQATGALKDKDMVGIPWMTAFALRDMGGWYLRSDIIWAKGNPMPESVTDRPTKSHEHIFLLAKSKSYFYDADAIREPISDATWTRDNYTRITKGKDGPYAVTHDHETPSNPLGRNKRDVWFIDTASFKGAHFATFPPKLIKDCILAGTSEKGCCAECGTPLERISEKGEPVLQAWSNKGAGHYDMELKGIRRTGIEEGSTLKHVVPRRTSGWKRACKCTTEETVPCVVLDPFNGSGTTGLVAVYRARNYVGVELNPEYAKMTNDRIGMPLLDTIQNEISDNPPSESGGSDRQLTLF